MISLNPDKLSATDHKKILNGSIIPRPIAFVTTSLDNKVINGAPFSYFNIASSDHPLIMFSVNRIGKKTKDTALNILETEEFVIHLVDGENLDKINKTSESLPHKESEISKYGLSLVPSTKIKVPGIKESKVRFECVLEKYVELPNTDLFIGRIVYYHLDPSIYVDSMIDFEKLDVVSRLSGNKYSKLGEIIELERP